MPNQYGHFWQLWDKTELERLLSLHRTQTAVADVIGCTFSGVSRACKRLGVEYKSHSNIGYHHTSETKLVIAAASRNRTPEQRKQQGESERLAWERSDPERRVATAERMRLLGRSRAGQEPPNKSGFYHTCDWDDCSNQVWVSPSRQSYKRFCSVTCARKFQSKTTYEDLDYTGFTFAVRKAIWDRDKSTCQICGKDCQMFEHRERRVGVVHHLSYDKSDASFDNLVLICRSCHWRGHLTNAWPVDLKKKTTATTS